MFNIFKKKQEKKSDFELEDDEDDQPDSGYVQSLQLHLSRMIVYAESADPKLQREVSSPSIIRREYLIMKIILLTSELKILMHCRQLF